MWEIIIVALVVIALVLAPFVLLYLRRRWLTGQGGLFDCAYRNSEQTPGSGWVLGMARYRGESLEWFRAFSLSLWPKRVFSRVGMMYVSQRPPAGLEAIALFEEPRRGAGVDELAGVRSAGQLLPAQQRRFTPLTRGGAGPAFPGPCQAPRAPRDRCRWWPGS